jgi:proteasome component ECM29
LHSLLKHHRSKHPKTLETPITNWKVNSYTNFFSLLLEAVCTSATTSISHIASEVMLETIQYTPLDATDSEEAIVLGAIPEASINRQLASNELLSVVLTGNLKFDTMKLVARVLGLLALKDAAIKSTILDRCFGVIEDRSALKKGAQVGAILVSACTIATALRTNHPVEKLDDFVRAIQTSLDLHSADKMQHHGPANHIILASSEALGAMAKWSPQVPAIKAPGSDKTVLSSVLILLDSHDVSVVITAAYSIANMCLGDRSLASSNKAVIDGLLATFKVKGEESHFSIGEALSNVIAGWTSASSTDTLVVSKDQEDRAKLAQLDASNSERELGVMESTLQIVLQEYLLSSRPDTRMASAIWLLTILKNCGAHPELVKNLKQIQAGFTQLLSDSNEILQEVAGKGLSQVYELGDESTKKELVDLLVGALQKGSSSFKVTAESEIFSPGQLGTTPSGDKLTTYRELVTLAAEMNQPDLIYKFMQLSAHNSLWNSKKGAAFATGELASRAKAQIAPHLPQLIPKLYRTSFDPNPKIAASMTSLMTTLVTDQKSALSSHIHEVLRDLLDHIIDSQWRTREACCNALADLLPARDYEEVASELKELWERCFRVLDDIKESVRKAGEAFKKSLSNLTLRLCDPSYTNREHGRMALEVALPHLVGKGLLSPVKEVRNISINMLLKISKVSSFLLKPHIARIIPVLLRSLATLDSTSLNYLEQHASAYGISAELFDEARVAMSKSSPVHATIDFCVQQVDAHNILDLSPELATLLSADNHVSTRAGSAHVITQLALSRPEACRLVAHKLMLSLKKGINARALQVRRSYGYAMGQLARYAKKKTLEIVVNGLLDSYKNSGPDDTDLRAAIAEALLELSKASAASVSTITPEPKSSNAMDVSPDGLLVDPVPSSSTVRSGTASTPVLAPMLNVVVPVVFLARFDAKEETSKVFNKIWEECGASLALYVNETVSTFSAALESSSWQMKQQGARAIAKFSEILNLSQFTSQAPGLLQMLLGGLKGRTWTGKESLLDALSKLVSCCAEMWAQPKMVPSNRITPEEILKVISGEVVRKTLEYRKAALLCLTDVLNTFNKHLSDFDGLSKVKDLLLEQATQVHVSAEDGDRSSSASSGSFGSSNNTTSTEEKKDEESAISRSIRLLALQALCAGFPVDQADRQRDYLPVLIDVLSRTFKSTNQYIVKVGVVNNLKVLFPKISQEAWTSVVSSELLTNIVSSLFYPALGDLKYSVVRSAACVALIELLSQAMEPPTPVIEQLEKAVLEADKIGQSPVSSDRLLSLLARAKN